MTPGRGRTVIPGGVSLSASEGWHRGAGGHRCYDGRKQKDPGRTRGLWL